MNKLRIIQGIARLAAARATGGAVWSHVTLLVTMRCNCLCPYCDFPRHPFAELDTASLIGLLRRLAGAGTFRLGLSGGEPLLREDLPELLDEAANLGFATSLVTNGILLAPLAAVLSGTDYTLVTLDGGKLSHDLVRGSGSFDAAVKGLETVKRIGKSRIGIICPIHTWNIADLEEPLRVAEQLGTRVFYQPVQIRNGWKGPPAGGCPGAGETGGIFRRVLSWKKNGRPVGNSIRYLTLMADDSCGAFMHARPDSTNTGRIRCSAGRFHITILPDGRPAACCMLPWEDTGGRVEPVGTVLPGRMLATSGCSGCTISPYVENTLLFEFDLHAWFNALGWRG